jgi:ElaB/YqjD/DUF883 family membrane-anchored ribosome-binding protein
MEETRTALTEKLETLEQQVVTTVHDATSAVADTVEAVKEAVHDSVEKVKGSVEETVETVRETLDIRCQVERRPWTMVAGSVLLGYVAGSLMDRAEQERLRLIRRGQLLAEPGRPGREGPRLESPSRFDLTEPAAKPNGAHAATPESTVSHWLGDVGNTFEKEITKVKGLAIGTMIGVVRDLIAPSVPEQLRPELADVMNSITTKLGGKPIHGPILPEPGPGRSRPQGEGQAQRYASELGRTMGPTCR